jgi:peptidoglycan hydrolase CwlO-like protein
MVDVKIGAIAIIGILLGASGYFGYYQYQQTNYIQQQKDKLGETLSSLESEKSVLEQQNTELMTYVSESNKALDESLSKERQYESKIRELTRDVAYYKNQASLATIPDANLPATNTDATATTFFLYLAPLYPN